MIQHIFLSVFWWGAPNDLVVLKVWWAEPVKFEDDRPSSVPPIHIVNFWYVVSFRNESDSNANVVENRSQLSTFWPHVKIRGGMGEMFESIFHSRNTDILLTGLRHVVSRLYRCVAKKTSEVKYKGLFDYRRSGLKNACLYQGCWAVLSWWH